MGPASSATSVDTMIALDRSIWYVLPVDFSGQGVEPSPATFAEVADHISSVELHPDPVEGGDRLDAGDWVEAVPLIVGLVRGTELSVESPDGRSVPLALPDLRLLGELDAPRWGGDAAARSGLATDEAVRRLDRMLHAGLVRRTAEPTPIDATAHGVGVEPLSTPAAGPAAPAPTAQTNRSGEHDGRIPVYAPWHDDMGPLMGLGMVTAFARSWANGRLNDRYELRPHEDVASFLADLATRSGPAVLLCSNYVWSEAANLELAARAKQLHPDLTIIHGGPSSPRFEGDAREFLATHHAVADVLVRGEGEVTLAELLDVLAPTLPAIDSDALRSVDGITFLAGEEFVRTQDRPRISDLSVLPSPYLTGEFDQAPPELMSYLIIETNRGCPYGCTFCDWGSATMSRIRPFPLERVAAELEWGAQHQVPSLIFVDANFGIWSRDVTIAQMVADTKEVHGYPLFAAWLPAKNTTKHLVRIAEIMLAAGISPYAALALQTTSEATLEAVGRENISSEHYVALAASYRRIGLPLHGDLIIGLPGQTYDSYKADLQFLLDHEIMARSYLLRVLPNAPMNDPDYRATHAIEVDAHAGVLSTATMSQDDRAAMLQLRKSEIIAERHGLLRHLLRWLQWDHGIEAMEVVHRLTEIAADRPQRAPLLSWTLSNFDLFPIVPVGRHAFYREVRSLVIDDFGIAPSTALDAVLEAHIALTPAFGRTFPDEVHLAHDVVGYYRSATADLRTTGTPGRPERPLQEWAPAVLNVHGDPLGLCHQGLTFPGSSRDPLLEGDFFIGQMGSNELGSDLARRMPANVSLDLTVEHGPATWPDEPDGSHQDDLHGVPIKIGPTSRRNVDA